MKTVRIAAAQTAEFREDIEAALNCVADIAARAESEGASLLCFPEGFLQGYLLDETLARRSALDLTSPEFEAVLNRLPKTGPMIVIGLIEVEEGRLFNTAIVVDRGVLIGRYRKVHLLSGPPTNQMSRTNVASHDDDQIQQFIQDGFVRIGRHEYPHIALDRSPIDRAFPRELGDEAILWRDTGCDPHNPATWTKPVIRLSGYKDTPFLKAERTRVLHAAFDQIVGRGRWRLGSLGFGGMFVVRFPHPDEPGDEHESMRALSDDGWHIDTSFPPDDGDPNDFSAWRANVRSRGRALLMLFLFSDVGPRDAPTRIRVGSHIDMARHLAPVGEAGMSHKDMMLDQMGADRPEALATGEAGRLPSTLSSSARSKQAPLLSGYTGCDANVLPEAASDPLQKSRICRNSRDHVAKKIYRAPSGVYLFCHLENP
jgi:hypothetical protein